MGSSYISRQSPLDRVTFRGPGIELKAAADVPTMRNKGDKIEVFRSRCLDQVLDPYVVRGDEQERASKEAVWEHLLVSCGVDV